MTACGYAEMSWSYHSSPIRFEGTTTRPIWIRFACTSSSNLSIQLLSSQNGGLMNTVSAMQFRSSVAGFDVHVKNCFAWITSCAADCVQGSSPIPKELLHVHYIYASSSRSPCKKAVFTSMWFTSRLLFLAIAKAARIVSWRVTEA